MTSAFTFESTPMMAYTFGPFSLIPDRFTLTGHGTVRQLTPRLLAVLEYLIKHQNRVVTKDELIAEVWQGSFIEDGNVGRTVSTLRALLGDVAENPKYIQTVSRVGYRFIHPVDTLSEPASQPFSQQALISDGPHVFVGRRSELLSLEEILMKCEQGTSSIVCISGEAGIGKTTFVEKLLSEVQGRALIARSRCAPMVSLTQPYTAVIDVFTDLFNSCTHPDVHRRLAELAPTWCSQALPGSRSPKAAGLSAGTPNPVNRQFADAIKELSRNRPLILFIDDFHWADAESVDLIGYISLLLRQVRLIFIIAVRTTEILRSRHPFLQMSQELQVKGACRQIPLPRLSFDEVREYLDFTVPVSSGKESLAQYVYLQSEGNPLFMISLLGSLKATQALRQIRGEWRICADLNELSLTIPPELSGFLNRSIEQLDPDDRFLIRIASLQGMQFDSAILSEVSARPAIDVEERLDELARVHELIQYLGPEPLTDGSHAQRYQFIHALLWKAFQDSVMPSRKKSLGLKIASAISRQKGIES